MGKKRLSKFLLFVLNVVYFLAAVTILTIGSLGLSGSTLIIDLLHQISSMDTIKYILDVQSLIMGSCIYLVCLGGAVIILSFIGGFVSLLENRCLMICIGVCKSLIICFNLALIMYNAIVPYHAQEHIQSVMKDNLKQYFQPVEIGAGGNISLPVEESANAWAEMEFMNACCGASGYKDYSEVSTLPDNTNVSATCCMQINQYQVPSNVSQFVYLQTCQTSPPNYVNTRGCIDYVMQSVVKYRSVYVLTAASFTALEVLMIALTVHVTPKDSLSSKF